MKYRLAVANEQRGDYVVTAFVGRALPTGTAPNGAEHATVTPSLAYGKGWDASMCKGLQG